jgi:thiamine biosynthesis lipoprotein
MKVTRVPQSRAGFQAEDIGFEFGAMACVCEVRLSGLDLAHATRLAHQAIAEVRRIEAAYSRYRSDSILSRINAAAGTGEAIAVDDETGHLLHFAAQLHAASDGLFDVTSGVLRKAWDFKAARRPAAGQLDALLPLVGWHQVQWNDGRVALPRAGMELDFGGIGKEYAADRAATLLQRLGAGSAMVNLGGDIRLLGPRPDGAPWALGIAHPRHEGAMLVTMNLHDGALATSGDYERFFEVDGQRFCHVLNPLTGWPVAGWQSVSVVAPACLAAGALTTIAMLKGDEALAFLELQRVDYIAVDAQGRVHRGGPQWTDPLPR